MPNIRIVRILSQHSVPHFIKDGRIYADSMISFTSLFAQTEDLTGSTSEQLYSWLGY